MRITFSDRYVYYLCIAGFLVNYVTYSPGFMSPDSLDQFGQALAGEYTSWHPPAMAFWWHLLNIIHTGPELMLAFQLVLLWGICYKLATAFTNRLWQVLVLVLFFAAPFIQNFSGYIIKDTQMALSWAFAVSILLKAYTTGRRVTLAEGFWTAILVMYGTWVRHNALAGLLPVCLIWSWIVFAYRTRRMRLFFAGSLFAGILVGQKIFLKTITVYKSYPESVLLFHDLIGLQVKYRHNVFPKAFYENKDFDTAYIRAHFNPATSDNIAWNGDGKSLFYKDAASAVAMQDAWKKAIKQYPADYLANRWETFVYFLRLKKSDIELQNYFPWIPPNNYGYKIAEGKKTYVLYQALMHYFKDSFIMITWFWVFLSVIMLPLYRLIKDNIFRLAFLCLLLSSVLYVLPQFVLASTNKDFRYIYWVCIACTLAILLIPMDRMMRNRTVCKI